MIIFQPSPTECWHIRSHNKKDEFGQTFYVAHSLLDHIDLIVLVKEADSDGIEKRQVIM